ncbi:MAG: phosphoribosylformylglycinamidine synthase subunit PurL [Anaerolineales bacterium]|nr:phosphoribosylformylglycinamidine synthase subunit PurL [Anaerolineales bacterium]
MTYPLSLKQTTFRVIVGQLSHNDPRSTACLTDAHALGLTSISNITCYDLYFLMGDLSHAQLERLTRQVLHDPVTQSIQWQALSENAELETESGGNQATIEVTLRPGVTNPVAEQIQRASRTLDIHTLSAVSTGQRYVISGQLLTDEILHTLAHRLLCNPIIQRYALGEIQPVFPTPAESTGDVETFALRDWDDDKLIELSHSRRAALNLEEMQAIQSYCIKENRDLTDIEFEMIAQTWSEHCVHKTFKARITVEGESPQVLDNLFKQTIQEATRTINAPWVRSAFKDNAGIIDYDGTHELSFKVETHNHPSAIEPFGGANTGTGGVIRDVIGVSARPIASTDILCFGPADLSFDDIPAGLLHPRRIASGVVSGIQDYGNKIGIPTVNGAILYDPGYTSNPLVYCGCVGIAPVNSHPRHPQPGDRIVVIGGRTGRDGLRGATFSSMTMDAQTGEVSGASVQIGAPIVEKGLIDVCILARDRQLYHAITDCGAGGLSSAVGEMGNQIGGCVQLDLAPLKYPGLAPWEIWLSEAQERMVLAVPPEALTEMRQLCELYEVELTDIGEFTGSGRLVVRYKDRVVLDLDNDFLHNSIPQRQLKAVVSVPPQPAGHCGALNIPQDFDYHHTLLALLAHPNIASKESVVRVYDHEVQGATVIKPLMGFNHDGPCDACVLRPLETQGNQAFALSAGINPEYGKTNAAQMAVNAIDEALRNVVAVGADPRHTAILDNFCWGDPNNPHTLGSLVAAALACRDAAIDYGAPFISGKDSFNNEYLGVDGQRHAIPPTLLISAIGILQDWRHAISMDLKMPGNYLYLVGPFHPTLGGSHFNLINEITCQDGVPDCAPSIAQAHYCALHKAICLSLVQACHDISEGGLAVAAAEMAIGGRSGLDLLLPGEDMLRECFGETSGCLLAEVTQENSPEFEACFSGLSCTQMGVVKKLPVLSIRGSDSILIKIPVEELVCAWQGKTIGGHAHAA